MDTQKTNNHNHSDNAFKLAEFFQFVLTGLLEHTHSHFDHDDDDTHEHTHQHSSAATVALADFIPEVFQFKFTILELSWPIGLQLSLHKSFQSEILRPPIKS